MIEKSWSDSLWYALRFAQVTASKAYTVATASLQCNSAHVMSITATTKITHTTAMRRGKKLKQTGLLKINK